MTLPLFPELAPKASPHVPRPESRRTSRPALSLASGQPSVRPRKQRYPVLWLCLRFPGLPLQALSRERDRPCLVVEGEGSMARLVACNESALSQGAVIGMRQSAALAVCREPVLLPRSPLDEEKLLAQAADAAMKFSDRVSLLPDEGILLEVRGSLRLFGGLDATVEAVLSHFNELGWKVRHAVAPTPRAAQYLVRVRPGTLLNDPSRLSAVLGRLPLSCLMLAPEQKAVLQGVGCRYLKDVIRLPRDGLSKRFGQSLRQSLDQALGSQPDPRPCWRGQLSFQAQTELPLEMDRAPMLLKHAIPLLRQFCRFLRCHDSRVDWIALHLLPDRAEPLQIRLGLLDDHFSADSLAELLSIRMESLYLSAPIRTLSLESGPLRQRKVHSRSLFRDAADPGREAELLNRLRARLGARRVYTIESFPSHDPGQSWRVCEPGSATMNYTRPDRPLWLLPEPRPIDQPAADQLIAGPERIETGWWQGQDIARDYYRAINNRGNQTWVFRDRRTRGWFLHGLFG